MPTSGNTVEDSGIYKCNKCKEEKTCVKGEPFPPCCEGNNYILVRKTNA